MKQVQETGGLVRPWQRPGRLGFSLIELMVVVVLIGILAATIIPEMKGTYEGLLLRSASRELIAAFNTTSSRAVSLSQLLRVRLDPSTGQYAIEREVNDRRIGAGFLPVRDVPGSAGTWDTRLFVEVRSAAGPVNRDEPDPAAAGTQTPSRNPNRVDAIRFYPDGTADAAEILLQDREGFRLALRINPVTARVRVLELERK